MFQAEGRARAPTLHDVHRYLPTIPRPLPNLGGSVRKQLFIMVSGAVRYSIPIYEKSG